MVVAITKIRTDDTMTSFFSLSKESLILATSPKAMAPLIKAGRRTRWMWAPHRISTVQMAIISSFGQFWGLRTARKQKVGSKNTDESAHNNDNELAEYKDADYKLPRDVPAHVISSWNTEKYRHKQRQLPRHQNILKPSLIYAPKSLGPNHVSTKTQSLKSK